MFLRKLCAVLATALAVSAVTAGTSQAMWAVNTTTAPPHYHGLPEIAVASELILTGSAGGSTVKIKATGVKGIESEIAQNETLAQVIGQLDFTGVSVVEPSTCKAATTFETAPLTGTVQMGNTEATKSSLYTEFMPTSGEVFATIKLEGCTLAGSYQLKGTLYGKNTNGTGVFAASQGTSFSGAINSSQKGTLTLGKEAATLEAGIKISLVSGEKFADNE